jgi:hypothetical protein
MCLDRLGAPVAAGWLGLSATRFLEALRPTEGGADTDVEDRAGAPARSALALTKPTARLMNTSRGPIVVETDLLAALRDGKIAGAGIDIFEREPLPYHHPFRSQDLMSVSGPGTRVKGGKTRALPWTRQGPSPWNQRRL